MIPSTLCPRYGQNPPHMKLNALFLCLFFFLAGCGSLHTGSGAHSGSADGSRPGFTLTIAHLNDTHSHLEPTTESVNVAGKPGTLQLGGFPRIATLVKNLRSENRILFLHAGDVFQGSLYFTVYRGKADWQMLNLIGVDAMTLGNHEFDRGPALVAELVQHAAFPVVAANVDARNEPLLAGKLPPYAIFSYQGERVGVIGLAFAETAGISNPGGGIRFSDPVSAARGYVSVLERQGVNKIVVVSHNGYDSDMKLARSVSGIDVIVDGHSHTLLGNTDLTMRGLIPQGPYPTVVTAPDGKKVLIVSAWEWGKVLGVLEVTFDESGSVAGYGGKPILVGEEIPEDPEVKLRLEEFRSGLLALASEIVAVAMDDLPRYDAAGRPVLGKVVAESMLWKARALDPSVTVALQNAGGIRADIARGNVSVGTVMSVLPFDNTLVLADLRGRELQAVLQESVDSAAGQKIRGPIIASGLTFSVEKTPSGTERVTGVQVRDTAGRWQPLDPDKTYRTVTSSFLAAGGDFNATLKTAPGFRRDTLVSDADAFMEYARAKRELKLPTDPVADLSFLLLLRSARVMASMNILPWQKDN